MILFFDTRISNQRNILYAVVLAYLGECSMNPDAVREDGDWVLFTRTGLRRAMHLEIGDEAIASVLHQMEEDGCIETRYTTTDHLGYWISLTERGRNLTGIKRSWKYGGA